MLDWIQDNRDEFLCHFTEIGDDSTYAEELREEHKQFEENCFVSKSSSVDPYKLCFHIIAAPVSNNLLDYDLQI